MALAKGADDLGAGVPARGPERAEGRDAALQLALLDDRLAPLGDGAERGLGVRAQGARGVGRADPAPDAGEERDAELGLQPADLLRERRLGEQQPLGGGAERAFVQGGEEVLQLLQRHGCDLKGKAMARRGNQG